MGRMHNLQQWQQLVVLLLAVLLLPAASGPLGAYAAFVDPLMAAAAADDANLLPAGLTPLYDPANSWSTATYDWTTGKWSAPAKQQQWWLGMRPLRTTTVQYYPNADPYTAPIDVPFYSGGGSAGVPNPNRVEEICYGTDTKFINICPVSEFREVGWDAVPQNNYAGRGYILAPKDVLNTTKPASVANSSSYFTPSNWFGWKWTDESEGDAAASTYDNVCRLTLLQHLVPPGASVSWELSINYGAAPACSYSLQADTTSQYAVYDGSSLNPSYIDPDPTLSSFQRMEVTTRDSNDATGNGPYAYCDDLSWYSNADEWSWVNMIPGVKCTLSRTPAPADVLAMPDINLPCAKALPHGVPVITCRYANNTPVNIIEHFDAQNDPFEMWLSYPSAAITTGAQGLLPRIPCNRAAASPRFGGRCAAPVVQYLAYDEAYYTPEARAAHAGLPEYGGCLAGGLMRWLTTDSSAWTTGRSRGWFTAPQWPLEVWRGTPPVSEAGTAKSFYTSRTAEALNGDQVALDRLFVWQDIFKLPGSAKSSGCALISMNLGAYGTKCWQQPANLATNTGWSSNIITVQTCDASNPLQCFQIEGDLAVSAKIMYKDLCLGVDPTDTLPDQNRQGKYNANMRPCDEGWTSWQRTTEGYMKLAGCKLYAGSCPYALRVNPSDAQSLLQLYNTRCSCNMVYVKTDLNYGRHSIDTTTAPVWPSYYVLRNFWLGSFASNTVDARAHRMRFVPPGARQGPNTRGVGPDEPHQGCNGKLSTWITDNTNKTLDSCEYNAGVWLDRKYTANTCMNSYLAAAEADTGSIDASCFAGTSWMYTYGNQCDKISDDMRLSQRMPGGAEADKCASRVGGQYVKVDDLWTFMASEDHDPCGWPFIECQDKCSLPSNLASKGWAVHSGYVYDSTNTPVGCLNNGTCLTDSAQQVKVMRDPKVANQIAAIDWRNLTLYSANLDFSAFNGSDKAGKAVWYLNLNFNMLGGDVAKLAGLPQIFPNLRHLGLAHCSAGKYAPEYAWQQSQPAFCQQTDHITGYVTNQACYCADEEWKDMTIVPSVGTALYTYKTNGSITGTVVQHVTRMLYGSIPSTWGSNADGSVAAWANTLTSVNLAGHSTLHGDLPADWYNQSKFPKLYYLKLKGTNIRPNLGKLTWNSNTCNNVQWSVYSNAATSVTTWAANCNSGSPSCQTCDWWPSRSAARWYYDATYTALTCGNYFADGSHFNCTQPGYVYDSSKAATTNPDAINCCKFQATCGMAQTDGTPYQCPTGSNLVLDNTKLSNTNPSDASCCKVFSATCGMATIAGGSYQCPNGYEYDSTKASTTNPSTANCCRFIPQCGMVNTNGTAYQCQGIGFVLNPDMVNETILDDQTCCKFQAMCDMVEYTNGAKVPYSCPSGWQYNSTTASAALSDDAAANHQLCCYQPTCAVKTYPPATPHICPAGYAANPDSAGSTMVNDASCCYQPTCGAFYVNGNPYPCPADHTFNTSRASDATTNGSICCYQPTCSVYTASRAPYTCSAGQSINSSNAASTITTDAECCYTPTCEAYEPVNTPYTCPAGYAFATANSSTTSPSTVNCCEELLPDVTVAVSPPTASTVLGGTVSVTITVINSGEWAAASTTVTHTLASELQYATPLPSGCINSSQTLTCTLASAIAAAGGNTSYTVSLTAAATGIALAFTTTVADPKDTNSSTNGPVITNITVEQTCAHYNSDGSQINCGSGYAYNASAANTANPSTAVCCRQLFSDLYIMQSPTPSDGKVLIGDTFTISLGLTNQGELAASNVTALLNIPSGLQFVGSTPSGCSATTSRLTCSPIGSIAPNATQSYAVSVKGTAFGTYTTDASVSGSQDNNQVNDGPIQATIIVGRTCAKYDSAASQFDCGTVPNGHYAYNAANATSTSPTAAVCCRQLLPDVSIGAARSPAGGLIGDTFTYTLTVTNLGDWDATATNVTHTLASGLTYKMPLPTGCSASGQTLTCVLQAAVAASGGTATVTVSATATSHGSLTASTSVQDTADSDSSNNGPVTASVTVGRTCAHYNSDGSQIDCGAGYAYKAAEANNANPSIGVCCRELLPDLVVTVAPSSTDVFIGDTFNSTVTVINQGEWAASGTTVNHTLPTGLVYVTSLPTGCSASGLAVTCTTSAPIAVGPSHQLQVILVVKATAAGIFQTQASVQDSKDNDTSNNGPVTGSNITVSQTCAHYKSDGGQFDCGASYVYKASAANDSNPSRAVCCDFESTCGTYVAGGAAYPCPAGYTLNTANSAVTNPDQANCCQYVPTCGAFWENGTSYQCPPGTEFDTSSAADTSPNDTSCCNDINGCAGDPCAGIDHAVGSSCADRPAPDDGFTCTCDAGYTWVQSNNTCTDKCWVVPNYCNGHSGGNCSAGICSCTSGWEGNRCQYDTNGCANNPCNSINGASPNSCVDVPGPGTGYTCSCIAGYSWLSGTTQCIDTDGCAAQPCETIAHAIPGSCADVAAPGTGYTCNCSSGYIWVPASRQCRYQPVCGAVTEGGSAYACPAHYGLDNSKLTANNLSIANCCRFIPTCGMYQPDGSPFPCPNGYSLNSTKAAATEPNVTVCCKALTPQLGQCEMTDLRPIVYAPKGAATAGIPVLVEFPSAQSRESYCPVVTPASGSTANMCTVKLQELSAVFAVGADGQPIVSSTAPPAGDNSITQAAVVCVAITSLSCELSLPLVNEGRYKMELMPAVQSTTVCQQQVALQSVMTQVLFDMRSPILFTMQLTAAPSQASAEFRVTLNFSEPVVWVADNTSTSSGTATSTPASSGTSSSSGTAAVATNVANASSSSKILLVNAVLMNLAAVAGSEAYWADDIPTGAATAYHLWVRSWGGAAASVEVQAAAYADLAGNMGQNGDKLEVGIPGSNLLAQAATMATAATAVSATASAAAAIASAGVGGTGSLLRSVGHTQFLAMSVSLAVPWLPPEYIELVKGLEWSNLVKPAQSVMKLTASNSTVSSAQQQTSAAGRRLTAATTSDMGNVYAQCSSNISRQQCTSQQQMVTATGAQHQHPQTTAQQVQPPARLDGVDYFRAIQEQQERFMQEHRPSNMWQQQAQQQQQQQHRQQWRHLLQESVIAEASSTATSSSSSSSSKRPQSVQEWLTMHEGAYGGYQPTRTSNTGVTTSGSSSTAADAVIAAGTMRSPAAYSIHDLQMNFATMVVALIVATILQGIVMGIWRLLRLEASRMPMLFCFPKPQLLIYTLLMVPIVYGGSKLVAAGRIGIATSGDAAAGLACVILLPMPVFAFWTYVLWVYVTGSYDTGLGRSIRRTKSGIMRTYQRPGSSGGGQQGLNLGMQQQQGQSMSGSMGDNGVNNQQRRAKATLALLGDVEDNPTLVIRDRRSTGEEEFEQPLDESDNGSADSDHESASGPSRAAAVAGPQPRVSAARGRPWRSSISQNFAALDGTSARAGHASRANGAVWGSGAGDTGPRPLGEGKEDLGGSRPQAHVEHPAHACSSSWGNDSLTADAAAATKGLGPSNRASRPVAEGVEPGMGDVDQDLAAAWQAARAGGRQSSMSGWGGTSRAGGAEIVSSSGVAVVGRQQGGSPESGKILSMSVEGGPIKRQQTWMGGAGPNGQAGTADNKPLTEQEQQQAAASAQAAQFFDKFGYLVDDLLGDDYTTALPRVKFPILSFYIVSSLQRCLTALFFGLFHFSFISVQQLSVLVGLHAGFIVYLLKIRPYASKLLLSSDLLAYGCETAILVAALILRGCPGNSRVTSALVTCYFVDVSFMIVPEILRFLVMGWNWWQRRRQQQQQQQQEEQQKRQQKEGYKSIAQPEALFESSAPAAGGGVRHGGSSRSHVHRQTGDRHKQQQRQQQTGQAPIPGARNF